MRGPVADRLVQGAMAALVLFSIQLVVTLAAFSSFNGRMFLQVALVMSLFGFVLMFAWPASSAPRSPLVWNLAYLLVLGTIAVLIRFTSVNLIEIVYPILQLVVLVASLAWTRVIVSSMSKLGEKRT